VLNFEFFGQACGLVLRLSFDIGYPVYSIDTVPVGKVAMKILDDNSVWKEEAGWLFKCPGPMVKFYILDNGKEFLVAFNWHSTNQLRGNPVAIHLALCEEKQAAGFNVLCGGGDDLGKFSLTEMRANTGKIMESFHHHRLYRELGNIGALVLLRSFEIQHECVLNTTVECPPYVQDFLARYGGELYARYELSNGVGPPGRPLTDWLHIKCPRANVRFLHRGV